MITPHPRILRALLSRYAEACVRMLEDDTAATRHVLEDVSYTLCVTTGTSDVKEALAKADAMLAEERSGTAAGRSCRGQADQTLVA
ncbi:DUF5133 domain-containing protein [Streptomyces sp. NPDC005423]|uniref:DUF5133 domain-containing protein n=1 Tax=Streptomyces sp. NPDC005423 TaxID=3155343 RepID=UPI0033B78987